MTAESYEQCKAVNDRRHANLLALSAEYVEGLLARALDIAAHAIGAPGEEAAKFVEKTCGPALMVRPEVIAALVTAQAQVFTALSAAQDSASDESVFVGALGSISDAVGRLEAPSTKGGTTC